MSVARIFKAATPYNAVELPELDYVQAFDVVYLAHLDHDPTQLVRASHTDWTFTSLTMGPTVAAPTGLSVAVTNPNIDSENSGNGYFPQPRTYVVTAINDTLGQESRPSNSDDGTNDLSLKRNKNVLTWSGTGDRYRVYAADNQQAYGFIGETTGVTFTDDNIAPDLTDGPPEAYNPFADSNRPSTVTFFEQRLLWARTRAVPNGIYGSRSADFLNMDVARPARADDAIAIRVSAQKVNSVHALVPLTNLLALTGDGVFIIAGSDKDYLSASPPPLAKRQSGRGVSRLKPLVVDEVVFYQPAIGSGIRSLGYTFEIDGFRSNDVSIFSPGLFRGFTIKSWTYAEEPMSALIAARDDGAPLCFTWQQEQQVWGWTRWETSGTVESICAIPEGGENRVYQVVVRTIAGEPRRFLERLASAKWEDLAQSCYLDCAVSFEPEEPTRSFYVAHLAGHADVSAIADGFAITGLTVGEDGYVDIGYDAESYVSIGLPYEALIETLPLDIETPAGSTRNKRQQVGEVVIQVADTRLGAVEIGRRLNKMYALKARTNEPLGTPTALFSGAATTTVEPFTSGESSIFIRSGDPLPMTICAAYLDPIVTE